MRLDKFLVAVGLGSRSQVKSLLKGKEIKVNGVVTSSPKVHINENLDQISYQEHTLVYEEFVYYILNKPKGYLSATQDKNSQTVLDLLDAQAIQKKVFPVGRLDKDTHGLLLLTNNGQLAHELLSPKKHVDKVYLAQVSGLMTDEDKLSFQAGIPLSDHECLPAQLDILDTNLERAESTVKITIKEGKFHQVKRMVSACGKTVTDLQRISMGPLSLDPDLQVGQYRFLSEKEIEALLNLSQVK
ncbi:rRNA pseudouridine synthase [Streptococcus didelphis]|uniref:pseudouridine synthase n=1 Tax=Streptococcus didelphis TaxID=102886 RepID=UPI00035CA39E|nr:pseudouridine synthase [Streptococcus didelphis]WMB30045.1 rRNA pseudouridine synthase [Streptococcus didelphis]